MEGNLIGNFSEGGFFTIPEIPLAIRQSVMPVIAYREREHHCLGTCFAISNHGITLTARHVLDDLNRLAGAESIREQADLNGWWFGALYVGEDDPNKPMTRNGGILPAKKIHFNAKLDIAVMTLRLPTNVETGELLQMPAYILRPRIPDIGEEVFGLGWHSMSWKVSDDGKHDFTVDMRMSSTKGEISEVYFPLRDSAMLDFPCFQTSSRFDHGMSGGPVTDGTGRVVGVVCSSLGEDKDGLHTSFVSMIGPALSLSVDMLNADREPETGFLYNFVEGGSVSVDDSIGEVRIERTSKSIALDFGQRRIVRNEIVR